MSTTVATESSWKNRPRPVDRPSSDAQPKTPGGLTGQLCGISVPSTTHPLRRCACLPVPTATCFQANNFQNQDLVRGPIILGFYKLVIGQDTLMRIKNAPQRSVGDSRCRKSWVMGTLNPPQVDRNRKSPGKPAPTPSPHNPRLAH